MLRGLSGPKDLGDTGTFSTNRRHHVCGLRDPREGRAGGDEECMRQSNFFSEIRFTRWFAAGTRLLVVGLVGMSGSVRAQGKPAALPDAQVEANVLKTLADSPQLADQSIASTTAFGAVTLSGSIRDAASRDLADKLVSNTAGVQKVVDQMTIGLPAPANSAGEPQAAANDGQAAGASNAQPPTGNTPTQGQGYPTAGGPPQSSGAQQPVQYPAYGGQGQPGQYPPSQPPGQYPPQYPSQNGGQQQGQDRPPYGSQYPQQPNAVPYDQRPRPSAAQRGGEAVVVPSGSLVRVRINQGMDSKRTAVGTAFDGVVLNDVVAGGSIAIPRGAAIRGAVVESHRAGDFKGKGELKLQLTELQLGGRVYPIVTDFWWHQGADKTGNTVGNSVGLGAVGALIGAVAGGGGGALVGAGIGGVAGLGVSASQHRGEAALPPEAIVTFHLTQPADVTTVSQAELNRLGTGVPAGGPPQMQRRYPPPPPPPPYYYGPGYYGPGYYPPPY